MREIVLDTETTGFDPEQGDRLVEIGALELMNHMPTGRTFHQYFNPERDMPQGAFDVHANGAEILTPPRAANPGEVTLKDKPLFRAHAQRFLDFIGDARLVIHNAKFDLMFLNAELGWLGLQPIAWDRAIDTLEIARRKFPGSPASLDALCRRFGVDNSTRTLHGALLDSEILAEVYLELIGGRQPDFGFSVAQTATRPGETVEEWRPGPRPRPLPSLLTDEEVRAHDKFVAGLGETALWRRLN